jgi:hypothetical protein
MKVGFPLAVAMGWILIPWAGAQVPPRAQSRARTQVPQPQQQLAQPLPSLQSPPSVQPSPLVQPQSSAGPPASVTPPTPEQMPATAPQVAYSDGILTITAANATLGDILRAVHHQTGASVDVPGNATERVVGRFGPGPARDVMASLLNGSHFNYVLLGSESDPSGLDRVVLLSKSAGGEPGVAQARFANAPPPTAQAADTADASSDDDAATDMAPDAEATDEQTNQGQTDDQSQGQPPNQPAIKTPEQLLQELQQRQQQLQQGAPVPPAGYPPSPLGGTSPQK